MIRTGLFLILLLCISCGGAFTGNSEASGDPVVSKICTLPDEVHETSGIIFHDGYLWTINDSGNDPILYAIDTSNAEIVQKVILPGIENTDWEAITQDADYIYIADNGNNFRSRSSYQLYAIAKDSMSGKPYQQIPPAKTFEFSFKKAMLDSIDLSKSSIDSEAIIVQDGVFYFYTKDWLYNDVHAVSFDLTDSLMRGKRGGSFELEYAATAATLINDRYFAILGYRNYHSYLTIFEGTPDLSGDTKSVAFYELYDLQGYQTEALTYADGHFYISCEKLGIDQSLFRVDVGATGLVFE